MAGGPGRRRVRAPKSAGNDGLWFSLTRFRTTTKPDVGGTPDTLGRTTTHWSWMAHEKHQANGRQPARRATVALPHAFATPSESEILERASRHFRLRTRSDIDRDAPSGLEASSFAPRDPRL